MLFTKEEVYDAKNVFQKMSLLPINLVSNSIQSLTLGNTILRKSAESREVSRPVAGRGYRLSDRVMNLLTGPFDSSLFTEATEFRKNLESEKSLEIKEQASSGHVAHLLDALACGKIKLSFKSEDVLVLNSSSLKVVASLDQTSRKRVRDDDSMEDDPDCADASSSVARLDSCLIEFDDVSHLSEGPVLEVYTCVVNSAKIGISFVSIQTETGLESQLIRSTLQTLVSYSLVYRVGFKSCVYVSKDNYKYWTVSTSLNESGDSFDESIRTLPFVWYNFNGSFNFQVYNACVTTILSMVIKRPGIYESALVSSFSSFLCAVEVGEILSDLIGRGSIFKKSMLMEGSMNDFASFQKVTVALVDNDVVDDGKISCYYPQVAIF